MRKYKYVIGNGLGPDRESIITFTDKQIADMTEEEIAAYVAADYRIWLDHNANLEWERVE